MLITLFLIGSWPFWFLFLCLICAELFAIERKEDAWLVTAIAISSVVAFIAFTDWRPWHDITFGELLGYGLVYIVIGALYAFLVRWSVYVIDKTKAFRSDYQKYKVDWEANTVWDKNKYPTFEDWLRGEYKMPPMPWDRGAKGRLYMWMVYWPISGAWVVIHKPLEYFFDWAYAFAKEKMAAISFALFKAHIES